jgi:hypothetical protein
MGVASGGHVLVRVPRGARLPTRLFGKLADLLVILLVSLFLSLAVEPGVNRLAAAVGGVALRRG